MRSTLFLPAFLLTASFGNFFLPASAFAEEKADSYHHYFEYYLGYTQAVDDRDICVERVEGRLQDKIKRTKRKNEWYRSLGAEGEKYVKQEPGEIEKEAAAYVTSICQMSLDDLHNLAQNYRYGRKGLDQDFDVAINLYHYMIDVYDDIDALHCLEDMGYIGGAPPTEEEMEAAHKKAEENVRNFEKQQIESQKLEAILNRILSFPFPPE